MTTPLADSLQIWGFQDEFTLFSDGSFGFGLLLCPLDVTCWDDSRIDAFANRINSFLNALPMGIDIQFIQEISGDNNQLIGAFERLTVKDIDRTYATLSDSRILNLNNQNQKELIPKHILRMFVRRQPTQRLLEKPRLFSKAKQFEVIADETLAKELNLTNQIREDLIRSLATLDLKTTILEAREIAELVYQQWNPSRKVGLVDYDPEDLRSSLLFTDLGIYERGFSLGGFHHRVISLKAFPDQTYASMARVLRTLPFNSKLFLTIHVPDQQKELDSLQTQRRLAFSMARGKRIGVSDVESEAKLEDLEELINQMVTQGEKVFHLSLNVLLRAETEEVLESQISQTLLVIRELAGAEGMEESLAALDVFLETSYPNARGRERSKRIKTSNAADLLPIYGPWSGHETPRILLKSLLGNLISVDPFSSSLSNYNQIVTGGSGSGKSFLTNVLLLQMLKENPKIFIVDIGGSYQKLCKNLSGQYIGFHLENALSINPFDLLPGEESPSPSKIKFLVGLVEMMTKEDGHTAVGRLERAEIEEAIVRVYNMCIKPCLSDLRALFLARGNESIQKFGKILTTWCGDTPYGRVLDAPTAISLNRGIVCFDLKGLEAYPDLQSICLYVITDFVWREVQKDRAKLKFLIFDECWRLLESDAGAAFIGEVFRTFRKYYASAIAISQNIDDFAKSRVAGAILPNTSFKWILMQKGADQSRLREVLQLNENEMALIASLHQEKGSYSQAFLMVEDKHAVVTIEPTPLEYWIATTDPPDLAAIEAKSEQNPKFSQIEILNSLSREFPFGVGSQTQPNHS